MEPFVQNATTETQPLSTRSYAMKTRIAVAVASLFVASLGATAFAQQTMPQQQMPPQSSSMSNPQQMPPPSSSMSDQSQMPPPSSSMSDQSMSHDNMSHDNMSHGMSNDAVTDKVKQELKRHGMSSDDISVSFASGTATLSGTVASKRDVKKAKKAAMKVKGVKHVDTSGLQVQAQGSAEG